ncbi:permease [Chloroflexota bacterium]
MKKPGMGMPMMETSMGQPRKKPPLMSRPSLPILGLISAYALFLGLSWLTDFSPGKEMSFNFATFAWNMTTILPFAFILIGIFEVWVKQETIVKHFGESSGLRGHLLAIVLAGTAIGGIYVAFPVSYSLFSKGAKLSVIFTYLGASAICRIPMTIFEASFLGIQFTIIRYAVSLPLIIIASILLGNHLTKKGFRLSQPGQELQW